MSQPINTITLPLPFRMGTVNCYLVQSRGGYVLIDTGASNKRAELEKELAEAGCQPGNLELIILTHGDFDHTGNAAYLRETFGAEIAMHEADAAMAREGDMFSGRKSGNPVLGLFAPILFRFPKSARFTPDVYLAESDDLSVYGLEARVVSLPGHSLGSIGLLTAKGDLFCGDLLENLEGPAINSIMDDLETVETVVEKLSGMEIGTVYPGHGRPFAMEAFLGEGGWENRD
jgi:glyoxylase-like metal-dependent hydrolase (beta-lactamase superfamily II)